MNADEKGRGSQDVNRSSVNTTRHVHVTFEHLTNPRNLDRARRTARRRRTLQQHVHVVHVHVMYCEHTRGRQKSATV